MARKRRPGLKPDQPGDVARPRAGHSSLVRRHVHLGWWWLLCFLSLGIVLETFHGLKVGWYTNVANETRRLMWTLAHTHGTLLGLVHIAFAFTVYLFATQESRQTRLASACLTGAGVCMPSGFFLGGVVIYDGNPGLGVLLVPVGAVLLLAAVLSTVLGLRSATQGPDAHDNRGPDP